MILSVSDEDLSVGRGSGELTFGGHFVLLGCLVDSHVREHTGFTRKVKDYFGYFLN